MMGEEKMRITDVAEKAGLHRNTVALLYKETAARIELDTLNRLCELFQCGVGDLLEFIDDSPAPKKEN
ncbi:helix-turn-helix domain-containing protein [Acidithiobacillus sp. IBUN Pt1247-S3]|uniref:helix-turn-helix domain-containing protein n=1 Tax=Acidithiobacillus sp. IBUN Pt1247-S3 TaxID=3166642 RepID=UPI0034E47892